MRAFPSAGPLAVLITLVLGGTALAQAPVQADEDTESADVESGDATSAENEDTEAETPAGAENEAPEGDAGEDGDEDEALLGGDTELRAPDLSMPDISMPDISIPEEQAPEEEAPAEPEVEPSRRDDPTRVDYRAPESAFSLRGYLRLRGVIWDGYALGRDRPEDPEAFRYFLPADRDVVPSGGCGRLTDDPDPDPEGPDSCGSSDRQRFGSMRLRLRPTLSLSEEVRVHATFDVFDNLVLGSTPASEAYRFDQDDNEFARVRTPGAQNELFNDTQNPPQAFRNSARDAIVVRRAWAEISNRGIGQLRFGRMASHWGLGMVHNAGNDLDGDFSTDLDRILFATSAFGLSGYVSYDFLDSGLTNSVLRDQRAFFLRDAMGARIGQGDARGVAFDASNIDDARQISAALVYRIPELDAQARLDNGEVLFEGGGFITAQRQSTLSLAAGAFSGEGLRGDANFTRRTARIYTPDLWARLRWGGLRIEMEAALRVGEVDSLEANSDPFRLLQFGLALEGEYRVPELDNKFYVRVYTGFATGDSDNRGMSVRDTEFNEGGADNRTLSQFGFHPNYRVDLILWRHIMGRVAGAWYLKPGLGYDIIRTPRGRLFGLSGDVVYSRAAFQSQSYGGSPNLGVELNLAAYYRSEDGPGFLDGFYASFQYGVLFTMQGLGYRTTDGVPEVPGGNPSLSNAQTLRLILGVQY